MLYHTCGGKLYVCDTTQFTLNEKTAVRRVRKCANCGKLITAVEIIEDAFIKSNYKRNSSYSGERTEDKE